MKNTPCLLSIAAALSLAAFCQTAPAQQLDLVGIRSDYGIYLKLRDSNAILDNKISKQNRDLAELNLTITNAQQQIADAKSRIDALAPEIKTNTEQSQQNKVALAAIANRVLEEKRALNRRLDVLQQDLKNLTAQRADILSRLGSSVANYRGNFLTVAADKTMLQQFIALLQSSTDPGQIANAQSNLEARGILAGLPEFKPLVAQYMALSGNIRAADREFRDTSAIASSLDIR